MANQITGKVLTVFPTKTLQSQKSGATFQKRELLLDATRLDPYTGERGFENTPLLEFSGERCKLLDGFQPGDVVTVSFSLEGRSYTNKTDGATRYMTTARGFAIERRQPYAPQQPQPFAQPHAQQQPQPAQQQQPYAQQPQPPFAQPVQPVANDQLPF